MVAKEYDCKRVKNYFIRVKTIIKYFFFQTQPLLTEKIIKNKRSLVLVTGCSSGYKTSSEKFLY